MFSRKAVLLVIALCLLAAPLSIAYAAGGAITGVVTDPKGAVIVGAAVTVIDPVSNQTYTATTDKAGRYKVEGLPAGTYTVSVSASGFSELRRENIKVEDDKTSSVDARLVIAAVESQVNISAGNTKPNTDSVYQQLRNKAKAPDAFAGPYARVNNLVLKRDAATFTLKSGEIYFLGTVEGRVTGGVFLGEGEITLTPPNDVEKKSLAIFNNEPTLKEEFTQLVLRFTDKTFDEIKASSNAVMGTGGGEAGHVRDIYQDNQNLFHKQFRYNIDIRTLMDIYAPTRPGYFAAFINGKAHSKLVYQVDPLGIPEVSPDEVGLLSYGDTDGGYWTSFYQGGKYQRSNPPDHRLFDITRHNIDAVIRGTQLTATDEFTFSALSTRRVLPINLFHSLRVSRVLDENGQDLDFIQENKDEDADFAIIMPKALELGKAYKLTVQYQGGDALLDLGGGNFFLNPGARETWYPNNGGTSFGDRALFEMTFHYSKSLTLIATGDKVGAETPDQDAMTAKWTSGSTELAVAGFNYGKFKEKDVQDADTGYNVEVFTNTQLAPTLRARNRAIQMAENANGGESIETLTGGEITSTSGTTGAGAEGMAADTQNAMRVYDKFFGKLPYSHLAMTQQPAGNFGQAWPTLVYMPYIAFLDPTTRNELMGSRGATDTFWQYVGPHEISHQWWGHVVGWTSFREQWMSEGFAEFSASLYVQRLKGINAFVDFWENQRKLIVEASPFTKGRKPYTVGPVTLGYRLNSGKTGNVARALIYPKGAYILHMIRMMMYDKKAADPDERFKQMMQDFVKTYYNQEASTEDFKKIVTKHMTKEMDLSGDGSMDWFFEQWVYGTEVPAYTFDYQLGSAGGKTTLSGRVTQSGVSENFRMLVPVWVDFGKGWVRLGSATLVGNSFVDLPNIPLPQQPKRVALCALNDVLATSVQNKKQ